MKRILSIPALFIALFVVNILVFKVLSILGFDIVMTETSYLLPPLLATGVLLLIGKKRKS